MLKKLWKSQTEAFQQSRGRNFKINDPLWPGFELTWNFIHFHFICKVQENPIKTEYAEDNVKQRLFFRNQRDVTLR